jgi:hypothetical protein
MIAMTLMGCATSGASHETTYAELAASCKARGGMLRAIPGAQHPDLAANYACEFNGAPNDAK